MYSRQGLKKYFINTSWLFVERVFRLAVAIFVSVFVARFLGPSQFGLLNYSISFAALFVSLASLGLDGIVVRDLVEKGHDRDLILGSAFVLRLTGAVIMIVAITAAIRLTSNDSYTNTLVFIVGSKVFFESLNVIDFFFQANVQSRHVVKVQIISSVFISIFQIFLVIVNASLGWFAASVLLQGVFIGCGLLFQYLKLGFSPMKWRFDRKVALALLKDAWPMIFMGILISVYMKIDQIMLKEMLGNEDVGNYAAAVKLSEVWYFIPMVICASLFPAIVSAKKKDSELYIARLQHLYDLMTLLAVCVALPVSLTAGFVVSVLYGEQYHSAGDVLSVHIWAGCIVFWGVARHKWILVENLQRKEIFFDTSGVLLNVILNYYLIPGFGPLGAAWATVISYFLASYLVSFFVRDFRISWVMFNKSFVNLLRLRFLDFGDTK